MFENTSVHIESLPKVKEDDFNGLNVKLRSVNLLYGLVFLLVFLGGFITMYLMDLFKLPDLYWIVGIVLSLIILVNFYVIYFGFEKKAYLLRENDIIYRTGLWWKSEVSVPFVRVQHSEVIQGPIERMFGLAKLKLFTAGGQASDLSIPGLDPVIAEELKAYITQELVKRKKVISSATDAEELV